MFCGVRSTIADERSPDDPCLCDPFSLSKHLSIHPYTCSSDLIEAHNSQEPKPTYLLGHNEYSDMTSDEFAQHFKLGKYSAAAQWASVKERLGGSSDTFKAMPARHLVQDRPEEVNWIALGGVTPVKNQVRPIHGIGAWAFDTWRPTKKHNRTTL